MIIESVKPGFIVTEHIRRQGGISYERIFLGEDTQDKSYSREWQTKSIIPNKEEYDERVRVISRAYSALRKVCANTPIGLICTKENLNILLQTLDKINGEISLFNQESETCSIFAQFGMFQVEENNKAAVAGIASQIAEMAEQVEKAITDDNLAVLKRARKSILKPHTPETVLKLPAAEKETILGRVRADLIKSAIQAGKNLETVVPESVADEIKEVIRISRRTAKELSKRLSGQELAVQNILNEVDLSGIRRTRFSFVLAAEKANKEMAKEIRDKISISPVPPRRISLQNLENSTTNS
jgi:hypothetical protein